MSKIKNIILLSLFDGAAAGDGAATGDSSAQSTGATESAVQSSEAQTEKSNDAGEKDLALDAAKHKRASTSITNVDDAGGNETESSINREQQYADFIEKYKDLDTKRIQNIINKRFSDTKAERAEIEKSRNEIESYNLALAPLFKKYGVQDGDVDGLNQAIENDDALYYEEAEEKGMTIEQLKYIKKVENQNARLEAEKRAQQQFRAQQRAEAERQAQIAKLQSQSEATKALYPDFDFQNEIKNQQFKDLVSKGVSVLDAYEVIHKRDFVSNGMKKAADEAAKLSAETIKANGMRPSEAGLANNSAAITSQTYKNMAKTKEGRAKIRDLVAKGVKVEF